MTIRANPFRPGSPIASGMFVGRANELRRLEACLIQTKYQNPSNFMITGERGIGKSSLMNYVKAIAEGALQVDSFDGQSLNFLVIHADIDQNTTQRTLISRIQQALERSLSRSEPARRFVEETIEFLKRVELSQVKLRAESKSELDGAVFDQFADSLADTINRIAGPGLKHDGVLLLIDEADNASPSLGLGIFLKSLTERLQRADCRSFMIGLAGLVKLRDTLRNSHESSLRLFEEVKLERLSRGEVGEVIKLCLEEAGKNNGLDYQIEEEAEDALKWFSDGYPHFIHQFGYSAFESDSDGVISRTDVYEGAYRRQGGAIEQIGNRYYRNDFYNRISKDSYRQVLRIMSVQYDAWVSKQTIRQSFDGTDTTLSSALKALLERNLILPREGVRGEYRLRDKAFALWIRHIDVSRLPPESLPSKTE
jgi:Cdc6-like AAA superfamily ATPase